jgi:hypothetical protein
MKIWAWMSTSPGISSRPLALIVRRASAAGSDGATVTILPPATPISIKPRSPPAGSSTSPPVSRRSYFIGAPFRPSLLIIVGHRGAAGNSAFSWPV